MSQDDGLAPFKYIFNIFFLLKEDQRCYVKPPPTTTPREIEPTGKIQVTVKNILTIRSV